MCLFIRMIKDILLPGKDRLVQDLFNYYLILVSILVVVAILEVVVAI